MAIPTEFSIKHKCGHTAKRNLAHVPAGKRKSYAFGLGKNQDCPKCFNESNEEGKKEWLAQQNAQELAEAEVFEEEHELPELEATEKNLSFATRTRYKILSELQNDLSEAEFEELLNSARRITRAGWWLSNRDFEIEDMPELITTAVDEEKETLNENPF